MIKAIIFDCFGVLATEGLIAFYNENFANDTEGVVKAKQLTRDFDSGLKGVSYEQFLQGLADLTHLSVTEVIKKLEINQPNRELLNYIRETLKPRYKLSILSNVGRDSLPKIFSREDLELFDDQVLSFEVGYIKPQPEIYELSAQRLSVKVSECVFIDDSQDRCLGAEAVGMKAIWYRDFEQMKTDLEELLSAGTNN